MDITLIVKASNQQFEDQMIKCEPSWTIRRLKGHLMEVYPGKPNTDEQKLIYSGQLLSDGVVLKDILRHYDGQQTHTVHLVFTPKNNRHQKDFGSSSNSYTKNNSNTKNMSPKTNSEATSASSSSCTRNVNEPTRAEERTNAAIGAEGLRQRNVTVAHSSNAPASVPTVIVNPMPPASNDFIMGQHLAMQNWMQQAYMQYLNQYMNVISNGQNNSQALYANAPANLAMPAAPQTSLQTAASLTAANVISDPILAQTLPNLAYYPYLSTMNSSPMPSASSIPAPITSSGTISTSSVPPASSSSSQPAFPSGASSAIPTPAAAGPSTDSSPSGSSSVQAGPATATVDGTAPAQPAAEGAAAGGAGGAAAAAAAAPGAAAAPARRFPNIVVEEQENRDWLDIFFSLCRVGILMTVVYLYSSPARCLTVFFIGIALYLYQIGFFRNNNADRLERARRIVVQQINNAHGVRANAAAPHARGAPVPPVANAPPNDQVEAPVSTAAASSPTNDTTNDSSNATSAEKETVATSSATEPVESRDSEATVKDLSSSAAVPPADDLAPVESSPVEPEDPSNGVPEVNRVNVNDIAAFLRTLVLSFFTSIIPDTPAA